MAGCLSSRVNSVNVGLFTFPDATSETNAAVLFLSVFLFSFFRSFFLSFFLLLLFRPDITALVVWA